MPGYNPTISSDGFQLISTASDHENFGIGNMIADVSIAIAGESLGAGLMGRIGMGTGGRPLMGMIPGVTPYMFQQGAETTALDSFLGGRASTLPSWKPKGRWGSLRSFGLYQAPEEQFIREYTKGSAGKFAGEQTGKLSGAAIRMGIGGGLRILSSAWLINDLFGMGFSALNAGIQGLHSYSYERSNIRESAEYDLGEGFADTRASFTQRQTAMAAIHNSQMNTRAAMGNEATFMHA
jgi:hypothetical protein